MCNGHVIEWNGLPMWFTLCLCLDWFMSLNPSECELTVILEEIRRLSSFQRREAITDALSVLHKNLQPIYVNFETSGNWIIRGSCVRAKLTNGSEVFK